MVNLRVLPVNVNEGEGWAGNVVFACGTQAGNDALGKRRFARPQIASKKYQDGGLHTLGELPAPVRGLFGRMSDDLFRHSAVTP